MKLFYKVPLYQGNIYGSSLPVLQTTLDEKKLGNIVVYKSPFGKVKEIATGKSISICSSYYDLNTEKEDYIKKSDLNEKNKIDIDNVMDYIEKFDLKTCPPILAQEKKNNKKN